MVVHGFILRSSYEAASQLWRDQTEMNMGMIWGIGVITAFFFTVLYSLLITPKNVGNGVTYGLLFGLGSGISMGFGSWSVMPIPVVYGDNMVYRQCCRIGNRGNNPRIDCQGILITLGVLNELGRIVESRTTGNLRDN